jgi:hypothetical protein
MKEKESHQIKSYFKMPNGKAFHCTYEKALKKLRTGRYGTGMFKEITKKKK